MKDSATFISYHELEKLFGIKSNFLAFQCLISALKSLKQLNRDCFLIRNKKSEDFLESFLKTEKANKVVYERLVRDEKVMTDLHRLQFVAFMVASHSRLVVIF